MVRKCTYSLQIFFLISVFVVLPHFTIQAATIDLGSRDRLAPLYTCPNMPRLGACDDSRLEETIEHYLNQSFDRDGLQGNIDVVRTSNGNFTAHIPSSAPAGYGERIQRFLENGEIAKVAVDKIKRDGKWEQEWRLLLQIGLPLQQQRGILLLHFPPDTVLETRDYLEAATIARWERILEENGASSNQVAKYLPIADISPIAAPASAGSTLEHTIPYFERFVESMLSFFHSNSAPKIIPTVAGGSPVRSWVKNKLKLKNFGVGTLALMPLSSGQQAPTISANHPSYIWYASKGVRKTDPKRAFEIDMRVMTEDLTAACWQVELSKLTHRPQEGSKLLMAKMKNTRKACSDMWRKTRVKRACELVEIEVYDKSSKQAKKSCQKRYTSS